LIFRLYVVPVAALFVIELITGNIFVHGKEGWLVVGTGRNGVECSVLLIACLVAVIVSVWGDASRKN
jgi:putative oxidoreductase